MQSIPASRRPCRTITSGRKASARSIGQPVLGSLGRVPLGMLTDRYGGQLEFEYRQLGLDGFGVIAPGAVADLVILDANLQVVETYIGGAPSMGL